MLWLYIILGVLAAVPLILGLGLVILYIYLRIKYSPYLVRAFREKPLFIIPRGQPLEDAEDVHFTTTDNLTLRGCYIKTKAPKRLGVVLFGIEFSSTRWSCRPYCESLIDNGFDVFAFEQRGQGDSQVHPGYEPMQWVTHHELHDMQAAIQYLKSRPDADPNGIGFFGVSRGGGSGLIAAATDPYITCCVTDGAFATFTTIVPYMRKWVKIYSNQVWLQRSVPVWYYELVGKTCIRRWGRRNGCRFPDLETFMPLLAPRPLLMIHGSADTYIKPDMAEALFRHALQPKELWMVEGAKHNQALHVAGDEYKTRVLDFFRKHLARIEIPEVAVPNGTPDIPLSARSAPRATA